MNHQGKGGDLTIIRTYLLSGGQTGADIAALESAYEMGFKTGGYAVHGYITSKGRNMELKTKYGLTEMPKLKRLNQMYVNRSKKNVDVSDVTIAFKVKKSVGTDKTIGYCRTGKWGYCNHIPDNSYRPILVINDLSNVHEEAAAIEQFIRHNNAKVINIAGHRDEIIGNLQYKERVKKILHKAFLLLID